MTMNAEELETRTRLLLDRQEIRDCIDRYARGMNRRDDEILASVFHERSQRGCPRRS